VKDGMDNIRQQICQYDLNGNLIATYGMAQKAADAVGTYSSSIIKVCRGVNKTHKGYIWRYAGDPFNKFDTSNEHDHGGREVDQLDLNGNIIASYRSIAEAARVTDTDLTSIEWALKNSKVTGGMYRWQYTDGEAARPGKRKVAKVDPDGNVLEIYESAADACRKTGIDRGNLYRCLIGKTKTCRGFNWEYYNE
jgi:hypothetical protein